jgi:hypothetical protein
MSVAGTGRRLVHAAGVDPPEPLSHFDTSILVDGFSRRCHPAVTRSGDPVQQEAPRRPSEGPLGALLASVGCQLPTHGSAGSWGPSGGRGIPPRPPLPRGPQARIASP